MPSLSSLTDAYPQQDAALPVEQPYSGGNLGPLQPVNNGVIGNTPVVVAAPQPDVVQALDRPEPMPEGVGTLSKVINRLTGTNGEERYQLWPEKIIREALAAPHDAITGAIPQYAVDPVTGDVHTSPQMIEGAQAVSALAGSGGLAGTTDATLGATPFLRPALKYGDKIYKAPVNGQHLDALPAHLAEDFQTKALAGEDIDHYNFGFMNHKGQFLDREKALDYAVKEGLVDPSAGQYGALTSTLLADSSKPGTAIEAMAKSTPNKEFLKTLEAHDATLPKEAQRAISSFVGGPHDTFAKGIESGIMNSDPLETAYGAKSKFAAPPKDNALVKEQLENAVAPIREALRKEHGDKITLYRAQGEIPKDAEPRKVLSMTADKDFANGWAGVKKVRNLYTEDEIKAARKTLDETGETKAGNYILKKSEYSPKYYDLHSKDGGYLTDSGGPEELLAHENEWLKQLHDNNREKAKKVGRYEVPVDNVVWYTNRFGQKEFIVKNDENLKLLNGSDVNLKYTFKPVDHNPFEKKLK